MRDDEGTDEGVTTSSLRELENPSPLDRDPVREITGSGRKVR